MDPPERDAPPEKSWLVWALDGSGPNVCELLPPDLDRTELQISGAVGWDFDATRPGVRRTHWAVMRRANRYWHWRRASDGTCGASLIIAGGTRDAALAKFKDLRGRKSLYVIGEKSREEKTKR